MDKITFINNQAPSLNATNLNQLQTNVENAINNLITNEYNESTSNTYSADYINGILGGNWTNTNYAGSVMSSNNGSVQSYSSINIFVNETGTLAYMTGTLYNNHATSGEAKVTFNSILRPSTSKMLSNIVALYNNAIIGENTTIATDGKITITAYGSANGNSRHTFIGVLIPLK